MDTYNNRKDACEKRECGDTMAIVMKDVFKEMADREKAIKPVPAAYETIEVEVSLESIFNEYMDALLWKVQTDPRGSKLDEQLHLSGEDVRMYLGYILQQRVLRCNGGKVNFTLLNELWVPSFFITAMSLIGNYSDPQTGLTFRLKTSDSTEYSEEEIQKIAFKFAMLRDVIQSVRGAAPRSTDGDPEVMTTACIGNHVRSMAEVSHPLMTYFTAFLSAKVAEEVGMKGLYKLQYDNLDYLANVFRTQGLCLC